MDQELRQRLVGAVVITALLAIFVPMLFDDDVDQTGKSINQLTIPEVPAKAQDVEIMPLPEKAEDVATVIPVEKPGMSAHTPAVLSEGEAEPVSAPVKTTPTPIAAPATSTAATAKPGLTAKAGAGQTFEGDADVPQQGLIAEDELPLKPTGKPVKAIAVNATPSAPAPTAPIVQSPVANNAAAVAQATAKPLVKPASSVPAPVTNVTAPAAPAKPVAVTPEGATRWYLNAGSFTQRANATALQESLKHQGFAATVKDAQGEKGPIYKVRIGPIQDKAKAQEVKNRLLQINVNTFVAADE